MRTTHIHFYGPSLRSGDDIRPHPVALPWQDASPNTSERSTLERFHATVASLRAKLEGARQKEREADAAQGRFEELAKPLMAALRHFEESVVLDRQDREFQVDVTALPGEGGSSRVVLTAGFDLCFPAGREVMLQLSWSTAVPDVLVIQESAGGAQRRLGWSDLPEAAAGLSGQLATLTGKSLDLS
jgi:hypothetical protein